MPDTVRVYVCQTAAHRDKAKQFLKAQLFSNITVIEETENVFYDRGAEFYNPPGLAEVSSGFVVIGVK